MEASGWLKEDVNSNVTLEYNSVLWTQVWYLHYEEHYEEHAELYMLKTLYIVKFSKNVMCNTISHLINSQRFVWFS